MPATDSCKRLNTLFGEPSNTVQMRTPMRTSIWLALSVALAFLVSLTARANEQKQDDRMWTAGFQLEKDELSTIGRNPHFILEPGYYLILEKGVERVAITVLNSTKKVGEVETRVVEEKETKDGKLVEVSRNYYAISERTNGVFYFGEDVDLYKNEKVVGHGGSWLAGVNGARFGLMMPGIILLRSRYYQELAPGVAMDRAEVVSMSETVVTPAAQFTNCLKVEETTPLEPGNKEYKYYAAGIGLVQDGALKLVKHGRTE